MQDSGKQPISLLSRRILRAINELTEELGRPPILEELAVRLERDPDELDRLIQEEQLHFELADRTY